MMSMANEYHILHHSQIASQLISPLSLPLVDISPYFILTVPRIRKSLLGRVATKAEWLNERQAKCNAQ